MIARAVGLVSSETREETSDPHEGRAGERGRSAERNSGRVPPSDRQDVEVVEVEECWYSETWPRAISFETFARFAFAFDSCPHLAFSPVRFKLASSAARRLSQQSRILSTSTMASQYSVRESQPPVLARRCPARSRR